MLEILYTCKSALALNVHSWTEKPVEELVQEYHKRAAFGGDYITSPDRRMCTHMFKPETKQLGMAKVST